MRNVSWGMLIIAVTAVGEWGCGTNPETAAGTTTSTAAASAGAGAGTLPADLDRGPRAGETVAVEGKAKAGEALFRSKGCSACHAFGKRVTGPDLAGVSLRRTAAWMESQILHPDLMVKQDPISRGLFAQYALQMPKQGLTPEEARAVIEYFKNRDHEAGEAQEAGKEKH